MSPVYDRVPGVSDVHPTETTDTAEVLRGTDIDSGDSVTIKVFASDITAEQFAAFAETCRRVRSIGRNTNIARLYDAGTTSDGRTYLVTEHHSRTLADRISNGGTLRWQEAVALGAEAANALEAAHRAGAVHGGLTPSAILLADDDVPVLDDFGVAAVERGVAGSGVAPTRLAHAAPEVIQGRDADERSDVYSLASSLYAAIAGTAPFVRADDDNVVPMVSRQLGEQPASLSGYGVPAAVDTAIMDALSKDPMQRPSSASLFRQELLAAARTTAGPESAPSGRMIFGGIGATTNATVEPTAVPAPSANSEPPLGRRSDRTRGMRPTGPRKRGFDAGVVAVVLVAIIAIIVVATRSGDDDKQSSAGTTVAPAVTEAAPDSSAATTAAPTTQPPTTQPATSDPLISDPTGTDPLTTDVGPTTSLGPNTVALEGTGYHVTTFTSTGGYNFTFPADRKYHYFEYSFTVEGNKGAYACPMRSRYNILDGPGLATLSPGTCIKVGDTATIKMRAKAYEPTKLTFNLFICDSPKPISYCEVRYRATNPIKITVETTKPA